MNKKRFSTIASILFLVMIFGAFLGNLLLPDRTFSADENRILASRPSFSISKYLEGRFETGAEDYANDQFMFRKGFIRLKSALDVTEGQLEAKGVYRCRDHYLMEDIKTPGAHFQYTENGLKQFRREYRGLNMYFLLAPNAANILSDKLPLTVRTADQNALMDSFYSRMKSCGYQTIDVRDTFRENKDQVQLYYRTDHHWTSDGAYLAYKKAAKAMKLDNVLEYDGYVVKKNFRGTLYSTSGFANGRDDEIKIYMPSDSSKFENSVIYYSDTKKKTTRFYRLNNLKKKDAYTVFGGSNHPLYTIQTPVKSNKTLLVIKDSYANSFIPFLSQSYRKIVVVDPRYCYDDIDDIIEANGVNEILFLYNCNTFMEDDSLEMMLSDQG